jgi:hypothetical protein
MTMGVGLAHLIQELYESLQIGLLEAVYVRFQVLVGEQFLEKPSIGPVGGVVPTKLSPDVRDRS